ncbi:unnamed protein product, partial [Heterosigma akashiwo]
MIAHHTCHGGYNRVDAGRFHREMMIDGAAAAAAPGLRGGLGGAAAARLGGLDTARGLERRAQPAAPLPPWGGGGSRSGAAEHGVSAVLQAANAPEIRSRSTAGAGLEVGLLRPQHLQGASVGAVPARGPAVARGP